MWSTSVRFAACRWVPERHRRRSPACCPPPRPPRRCSAVRNHPSFACSVARDRHDARVFVGQIDLILRRSAFDGRLGWFAAGLLTGGHGFRFPRRQLRLVLRQLPRVTFRRARFDLRLGRREFLQSVLSPRQFVRDRRSRSELRWRAREPRHAIRNVRLIRRFGFPQQSRHFRLQLRSILPACSYDSALCRLALA
jgi:hypothetical protein